MLPPGPDEDGFKLNIYVQIIDNFYGITIFNLTKPIISKPKPNTINSLLAGDTGTIFMNNLLSGDLKKSSSSILAMCSMLNNPDVK